MSGEDQLAVRIRLSGARSAIADARATDKAIGGIGTSAERSGKQAREASGHFKLMSGAVGAFKSAAGVAGFGGLAIGLKDAVQAALTLQSAQQSLRGVLTATGMAGTSAYANMSKAAERLSTRGGFTTPESLRAMTQFLSLTHSSTQAIALNAAATNVARARHIDLASAVSLVARATTGQTGRLQQYLGIIQPVKTHVDALTAAHKLNTYQLDLQAKAMGKAGPLWLKQQELLHGINPLALQHAQLLDKQATAQVALNRIQKVWGTQTSAYSHTAAGALSNLRNTMEGLLAKVGTVMLPIITKVARALSNVASTVTAHWPQISRTIMAVVKPVWEFGKAIFGSKTAVQGLIAVMAPLAAVWAAYKVVNAYQEALKGVKTAMVVLGLATTVTEGETIAFDTALEANPIGLVVAAVATLVAGLVFLGLHFKGVRQVAGEVFDWLKTAASSAAGAVASAFETVVNFVKQHWQTMLIVMTGGMAAPVLFIIDHFKQIEKIAEAVFKGITTAVGSAVSWIGKAWDGLLSVLEWPFKAGMVLITGVFGTLKTVVGAVVGALGKVWHTLWGILTWPFKEAYKVIRGIVNTIVSDFRWLVSKVTGAVSSIAHLPGKILGGIGHAAGSVLSTVTGGLLAKGGPVPKHFQTGGAVPEYLATGGPVPKHFQTGGAVPEYLAKGGPSGTDTVPAWLTPGEFVVNRNIVNQVGMPAMNRLNHSGQMGGQQNITIEPAPVQIKLDSRVLAEGVLRYSLKRAARGASSLAGGSLVTS